MRIAIVAPLMFAIASASSPSFADSAPPSFAGGYFGLNAGAAWSSSRYATDPGCPPQPVDAVFCNAPDPSSVNGDAVAASGTGDLSSAGFTGGVQGGYNWQNGNVVFGGEADFGAFDFSTSASPAGVFPFVFAGTTYALSESATAQWLATLRGRLGYAVTPDLLIYGTGGIAFTDFEFSSRYADNANGVGLPGGAGFTSRSRFMVGWTLGAGGEWLMDRNWSIKAEYLYVDFGSMNFPVAVSNTPAFTQTMVIDADLSSQVARIGINFRP